MTSIFYQYPDKSSDPKGMTRAVIQGALGFGLAPIAFVVSFFLSAILALSGVSEPEDALLPLGFILTGAIGSAIFCIGKPPAHIARSVVGFASGFGVAYPWLHEYVLNTPAAFRFENGQYTASLVSSPLEMALTFAIAGAIGGIFLSPKMAAGGALGFGIGGFMGAVVKDYCSLYPVTLFLFHPTDTAVYAGLFLPFLIGGLIYGFVSGFVESKDRRRSSPD